MPFGASQPGRLDLRGWRVRASVIKGSLVVAAEGYLVLGRDTDLQRMVTLRSDTVGEWIERCNAGRRDLGVLSASCPDVVPPNTRLGR